MKSKVVIFEDDHSYRESLVMLMSTTPNLDCVGNFFNCEQVLEKVSKLKPDVVLMDIDMPQVNGIEGLTILRRQFPDLKILMQTVFEDDEKVFACICAGADGYILKKASPIDLLEGIEEVLNGGAPMTPTIARQVLRLVSEQNRPGKSAEFKLTEREVEILGLMVEGLSYKMIADHCFIAQTTVNAHIRNIYEKLQVHSVAEAVAMALKKKLV